MCVLHLYTYIFDGFKHELLITIVRALISMELTKTKECEFIEFDECEGDQRVVHIVDPLHPRV